MLIRCPECKFERRIDEESIPANAVMATCPHCKCRFRFRNSDGTPVAVDEPVMPETPPVKPPLAPTPPTSVSDEDDPLPPGAVVPHIPGISVEPDPEKRKADEPRSMSDANVSDERQNDRGRPVGSPEEAEPAHGFRDVFRKARHRLSGQESFENEIGVPWEQPRRYNPLMGLYQTILQVMFNAPRFFAGLPASFEGLARPLAFYVIVGLFQTLVDRMWYLTSLEAAAPSITDPKMQEFIGDMAQSLSLPMTIILTPGILAIQLFFLTAVFYLMLRLVQPDHAQFRTVFRVIAYSAAPTIVCIIPAVGSPVGSVWFAVSCFVGCKYAMRLPWSRAALALGPLYLVAFAIGMQLFRQLAALA